MSLRVCSTCGRSVPEGDCAFCVPIAGTNRLRAGYAVVAAVTSVGIVACGTSAACAYFSDAMTPIDDAGPDEVPVIAIGDASMPLDAQPIDAAADGADAADATDTKDAGAD